jgi:hypothetical protein
VRLCGEIYKATNQPVDEDPAYEDDDAAGEVYVLVCALDYKRTKNPLSCTADGKNMRKLFEACEIPDENITVMYDEECTKENVEAAIAEVGGKCGEGDFFIFYYSGHGTNLSDVSGDEDDGQDEAFCFVTPEGQITYESCMTDDTFAECITAATDEEAKIIILTDCCHSGTIADFGKGEWTGRRAISITGCLDGQTSGDIGKGGIFTHSMLLAIAQLEADGEEEYSVGKLYNATLDKDNTRFNSQQDITMQCSPGHLPNQMVWPLIPKGTYVAPLGLRSIS